MWLMPDRALFTASAVHLDGERLVMGPTENTQEHILGLAQGELMLVWELHRADLGNAVEIVSGWGAMKDPLPLTHLRCSMCASVPRH